MKRLSICLIAFSLGFCVGMITVWILAQSTPIRTEVASNEPQSYSVTTEEPSVFESPKSMQISNGSLEETRIEQFTDEKTIGRHRKNKVEIRCCSRGDERFAEIKFFTRSRYGAWIEMQSFKFDKDGVTDCDPIIEDFNNDGLRDFTYRSNVAARGSNEVRKLFIYDKKRD
ncbi:MAG: hypothetical protein ABJB40_09225, partial [Acidobacteriota bacterium]